MSTTKYHVNREKGTVGVCRAKVKCRFGSDTPHFDNPQDAFDDYVANDPELSKLAKNVYVGMKAKEKASTNRYLRIPLLREIKQLMNKSAIERSDAQIAENSEKLNEAAKAFAPKKDKVLGFSSAMRESLVLGGGSNEFLKHFAPRLLQNKLGVVEPRPGDPDFIHRRGYGEMNRARAEAETVWNNTNAKLQKERNAVTFGRVKEEDYTDEKKQELKELRKQNAEAYSTMKYIDAEKEAYDNAMRTHNWAAIDLGKPKSVAEMQEEVEAHYTRRTGRKIEDIEHKSIAEMQKDVEAHHARRVAAREQREAEAVEKAKKDENRI